MGITFNTLNNDFFHISNKKGHFGYPSLSQDLRRKTQLKMVLINQILTKQYLKEVFPTFD